MGDNRIARLERRVGELEKRVTELEDEDGETALDVKLAMGEVKELLVDRVVRAAAPPSPAPGPLQ